MGDTSSPKDSEGASTTTLPALESISGSHLKNSMDLTQRMNGMSVRKKKLATLSVMSLFTNAPTVGVMKAAKRVV